MFEFTFGDVGSGKSLAQASDVLWCLERSIRIQKKYHLPTREVWCNFHMADWLKEKFRGRLFYWKIPQQMIFFDYPLNKTLRTHFDCFWDEMAVEIPSDKWKDTDPAVRAFFAQHRKRGIQIFGNTQDYMMLDINARRMATRVFKTVKVIGNRDPSSTLPPIKFIWGLIWKWELDKISIREDSTKQKSLSWLPDFIWITKKLCSIYDTTEGITKSDKTKLLHLQFECDTCGKVEFKHIPI